MTLTKEFLNDPRGFMAKHAFDAGDAQSPSSDQWAGVRLVSQEKVNQYFDTSSYDQKQSGIRMHYYQAAAEKMVFKTKLTATGASVATLKQAGTTDVGVYVYYLPWKSMCITSMKLPKLTDVRYFFTAGLSGCSVFVRGDPRSPTVYHAGSQAPCHEDATKLWLACMRKITRLNRKQNEMLGGVDKFDYLEDTKGRRDHHRTPESDRLEKLLISGTSTPERVKFQASFGCVFGLKDEESSDWSFYLQERAYFQVFDFRRGETINMALPVSLKKFFPLPGQSTDVGRQRVDFSVTYRMEGGMPRART